MKYTFKKILFAIISVMAVGLLPVQAEAANTSTASGPANCSVTFFYADSNGAYIGNTTTLKPKTDYQIKATWKPGTCAAVGSIRMGKLYTKDGKTMANYFLCFPSKDFNTASTYKYVYSNMDGSGQAEGTKISHFLYIGDSNSDCSAQLQDRVYNRTSAFAEISTTFKEKTAAVVKTDNSQPPTDNKDPNAKDTGTVDNPDTSVTIKPGQSFDTPLGRFYNPLEFERPEELVVRVINALLLLVGIISVIMIIIGGLRMVASGGSESQITKGKQTVIWAVGGLILSLMAFSIVAIIQSIIS